MNLVRKYSLLFAIFFWGVLLPLSLIGCKEDDSVILDIQPKPFERLLENQKMPSAIFKVDINYAVLLPADYNETKVDYPVVYLLHGLDNNEKSWYTEGNIKYYVDFYKDEIVPMIYVMPVGFNTYYVNKFTGNYPYMDMITKELVPAIDARFRTKRDKSARAVMGYSMGGYGALILPVLNPDVFTIGVPLSMSFRNDQQYMAEPQHVFDSQWGSIFGGQGSSGTARITNYFKQHSPFHFFNTQNTSSFNGLKLFIDCGDDEETLSITNDDMHALMRDRQIPHEYRTRNGGHSFDYWKKSYREVLLFISNAVRGIPYPSDSTPITIGTLIKSNEYETVEESGISLNVLKPDDYATSTANYSVVYFIHNHEKDQRTKNLTDVFSLYKNAMTVGKIPKSIIVEIPFSENLSSAVIAKIIQKIDASYRTKANKVNRVVLGNLLGGTKANIVVSENPALFGSCFLFDAQLKSDTPNPTSGVFYYLDITDDSNNYKEYHNFYKKIKNSGIGNEYRVRQGRDNYQSFLNGFGESYSSLFQVLK
ncbi:alpha/beta hydrolase-fold protein [Lutibacter sp.]|uniref:alpha/beta hydrolase-fold protein n=1 Tax=Lutibacter sp. TaxID=1925666 RepID=UPI002733DEF6|nr:alpha/beta hydrolase-fold protein [Lutibacter sp.]MDP3313120.1 alpha/beta hydrolase-fold protein [Lutibacter sp.]